MVPVRRIAATAKPPPVRRRLFNYPTWLTPTSRPVAMCVVGSLSICWKRCRRAAITSLVGQSAPLSEEGCRERGAARRADGMGGGRHRRCDEAMALASHDRKILSTPPRPALAVNDDRTSRGTRSPLTRRSAASSVAPAAPSTLPTAAPASSESSSAGSSSNKSSHTMALLHGQAAQQSGYYRVDRSEPAAAALVRDSPEQSSTR